MKIKIEKSKEIEQGATASLFETTISLVRVLEDTVLRVPTLNFPKNTLANSFWMKSKNLTLKMHETKVKTKVIKVLSLILSLVIILH